MNTIQRKCVKFCKKSDRQKAKRFVDLRLDDYAQKIAAPKAFQRLPERVKKIALRKLRLTLRSQERFFPSEEDAFELLRAAGESEESLQSLVTLRLQQKLSCSYEILRELYEKPIPEAVIRLFCFDLPQVGKVRKAGDPVPEDILTRYINEAAEGGCLERLRVLYGGHRLTDELFHACMLGAERKHNLITALHCAHMLRDEVKMAEYQVVIGTPHEILTARNYQALHVPDHVVD